MKPPHSPRFVASVILFWFLIGSQAAVAQVRAVFPSASGANGTLRFLAGGSVAGVSGSVSTRFFLNRDHEPPRITPPITTPTGENSYTLAGTISDDRSAVASATLHYRQGGEPLFSEVSLNLDPSGQFTASIPAEAITSRGLDYYIDAADEAGNHICAAPPCPYASVEVTLGEPGIEMPVQAGSDSLAYQLVSFPIRITSPNAATVLDELGTYDDTKWRFFDLKPDYFSRSGADQYNEFGPNLQFNPGKAFWLISTTAAVVQSGPGTTNRTDQPFSIPLHPGWNLVGLPFDFDVPRNKVSFSDGQIRDVYQWQRSWQLQPSLLSPRRGYVVDAGDASDVRMLFNPDMTPAIGKNDDETPTRSASIDEGSNGRLGSSRNPTTSSGEIRNC